MTAEQGARRSTFRALRNRNYRLWAIGQFLSASGTTMQAVAQAWLVLDITDSGTALGLTLMLQTLPILFLGSVGGLLADRFDRNRLYLITQVLGCVHAIGMWLLVITGAATFAAVCAMAVLLGAITAVDQPVRNLMVFVLLPDEDIPNGIALNMSFQSASRVLGPATAGLLISAVGVNACFILNAASYVPAVIFSFFIHARPNPRHEGDAPPRLLDGLRYVRATRSVRLVLISAAVVFGFAWEYEITVPLLARYTFDGGAFTVGAFFAAQSIGAVCGGVLAARQDDPSPRTLRLGAAAYGVTLTLAAIAPTVSTELPAMALVGVTGIMFAATLSTRLQQLVPDEVRGRVTALWVIAALGTRPIGAPIVGFVGQELGPRYAVGVGAAAILCIVLPSWSLISLRTRRRASAVAEST